MHIYQSKPKWKYDDCFSTFKFHLIFLEKLYTFRFFPETGLLSTGKLINTLIDWLSYLSINF